jgi:hypothetical protein
MGESYRPGRLDNTAPHITKSGDDAGHGVDSAERHRMVTLSWAPRVFHYTRFLEPGVGWRRVDAGRRTPVAHVGHAKQQHLVS